MLNRISFYFILLFLLSAGIADQTVSAQFPTSQSPGIPNVGNGPEEEPLDNTINVQYFYADNPGIVYPFEDTLMHNSQQYDPIRLQDFDHAHLGFLGSAHQQLIYRPAFRMGLDIGLHQYDLYYARPNTVQYYKLDKAFSNLFFTQGSTQLENYFRGQFGRNFANNLSFSLEYNRMNNVGRYRSQKSGNQDFTAAFNFHHPKGKYQFFLSYIYNEIRQKDNGGISLEQIDSPEDLAREFQVPVFLNDDAQTRYANRHFNFLQTYNFTGQADSLGPSSKRSFLLSHEFDFRPSIYKFYDDMPDPDSSYYGIFQVDQRSIRYFIDHDAVQNTFKLITRKPNQDTSSNKSQQKDLIEVGISHTFHRVQQEPGKFTRNDLFLMGRFNFAPTKYITFKSYGHLGVLNQAGDYRLDGRLTFTLPTLGSLEAGLISQAYTTGVVARQHILSEQQIWNNDFNKIFENTIEGVLRIPKLNLDISGQYSLLTNYLYYDTLGFPQQQSEVINVLRLTFEHRLKWGNLFFNNQVNLQTTTGDVLRLPAYYSKHSLYGQFKIFKDRLSIQTGLDLRLTDGYFANTYNPATGQFQLQDELELNFYPSLDAFFNVQVDRIRFFIKMENLNYLVNEELFYQTALYPNPFTTVRMGLRWVLLY